MKYIQITLPADTRAFQSEDGEMRVQIEYLRWAYAPDAGGYRELNLRWIVGSSANSMHSELYSYEDPHAARIGRLFTTHLHSEDVDATNEVELDGVSFSRVPAPPNIMLLPLPPMRKPSELLLRPSTADLIYLSTDAYLASRAPRLFLGRAADLLTAPIASPSGPRSRWFTLYPITESALRLPSAGFSPRDLESKARRRRWPTWDGERLHELMRERFLVVETDTEVRLCLNPAHSSWDGLHAGFTANDAWSDLALRTQAPATVERLLVDLRDRDKLSAAVLRFESPAKPTDMEYLIPDEDDVVRHGDVILAVLQRVHEVGQVGEDTRIHTKTGPALRITTVFPIGHLREWRPHVVNDAPAIDVAVRFLQDPRRRHTGIDKLAGYCVDVEYRITYRRSVDGTTNLEYRVRLIREEEDPSAPGGAGAPVPAR
jgi:hypothetical protein